MNTSRNVIFLSQPSFLSNKCKREGLADREQRNVILLWYDDDYPKEENKLKMEGGCLCLRASKSIISTRKSQTQKGQLIEETYSYISIVCNPYSISTRKNELNKKKKWKIRRRELGKGHFKVVPPTSFRNWFIY